MDGFLRAYWRLLNAVGWIERVIGVALLTLIVVLITIGVLTRYIINRPIVWAEDVSTFAFIWAAFLGAAIGFKELRHIQIDTFLGKLGPRSRALFNAALHVVMLLCCIQLARYAWTIMDIERRSMTISLPVNLPRHLFYSVPLFVGLVSIGATAVYFVLAHLAQAATGRPVDAQTQMDAQTARERAADDAEADLVERTL